MEAPAMSKSRLDPDTYLVRKYNVASAEIVIPIEYRPQNLLKFTTNYKREIRKAVGATGSLEVFAHAVQVVCDERKQKKPKSNRECLLKDLTLIRQNAARFKGFVVVDGQYDNAADAIANDSASAVDAEGIDAEVDDAEGDTGAALNVDAPDNGADAAGNTSTAAPALESDHGDSPPSLLSLTERASDGGSPVIANTPGPITAIESAQEANVGRKRSKTLPSQQSEGHAHPAILSEHSPAFNFLFKVHGEELNAAQAIVSQSGEELSTAARKAMRTAWLRAIYEHVYQSVN